VYYTKGYTTQSILHKGYTKTHKFSDFGPRVSRALELELKGSLMEGELVGYSNFGNCDRLV